MNTVATHSAPTLREEADFLIQVDLSVNGMAGRYEQLWTKKLGSDRFLICCLPFFTYGIALRDIVVAVLDEREQYMFQHVAKKSGHRLLRFAFQSKETAVSIHKQLHQALLAAGCAQEWNGSGYCAVDIGSERDLGAVQALLAELTRPGEVSIEVE